MWVFTRYGFVSIGCARDKNGNVHPDTVMIRARMREHLENLRDRFSDTALGNAEILGDTGTDYLYRMIVPKAEWASVLSQLALEQTWPHFKTEASRFERLKSASSRYVDALHQVWWTMAKLQDE